MRTIRRAEGLTKENDKEERERGGAGASAGDVLFWKMRGADELQWVVGVGAAAAAIGEVDVGRRERGGDFAGGDEAGVEQDGVDKVFAG